MAPKTSVNYENNPFMIGIEGLKLIFRQAKGVGIYAIVLTTITGIISLIAGVISAIADTAEKNSGVTIESQIASASEAGVILLVSFVAIIMYLVVSLLLFGVLEHAAAVTAKGGSTTLGQSFKVVLHEFPAYLWLYVIIVTKIFLWSLLLIVPGIIMMNRYVLSGTVFFAEGERGNAAIKRSSELVKGAWITTYGGAWAWNLISQGLATMVFWPGCMAVLYRQLRSRTDSGEPKPPAHVLSWLILFVPIALVLLFIIGAILIALMLVMMEVR